MPINVVVVGNCQAESLRKLISSASTSIKSRRIPPIHEWTAHDVSTMHSLVAQADVLVTQPVRDNYRDLPIGFKQLRSLMDPSSTMITIPAIRYSGFFPYQVIVRHPSDRSATPPLVPYHDLRTIVAARHGLRSVPEFPALSATQIHSAATESRQQLRIRETAYNTITVSTLFDDDSGGLLRTAAGTTEYMWTINHPANSVLMYLAQRVLERMGIDDAPIPPSYEMLGSVISPIERDVIDTYQLETTPRPDWIVDGVTVSITDVQLAHLAWYREHPLWIDAALERHQHRLDILGLDLRDAQ